MGLLIGLLLNFDLSKLNFISKIGNLFESDTVVIERIVEVKPKTKKPNKTIIQSDSLSTPYSHADSLRMDSINHSTSDSIQRKTHKEYPDDLIYTPIKISNPTPVKSGGVKMAKEELLNAIFAVPYGYKSDFLCRKPSEFDTLISNLPTLDNENGIYVEFWHSPLNLVGYKLSTNTLILYGFYEFEAIRLTYLSNGTIRLKYHESQYTLKCTDVFISLNKKATKAD